MRGVHFPVEALLVDRGGASRWVAAVGVRSGLETVPATRSSSGGGGTRFEEVARGVNAIFRASFVSTGSVVVRVSRRSRPVIAIAVPFGMIVLLVSGRVSSGI